MKVEGFVPALVVAANVAFGAPVFKMRSAFVDCADPIIAQQVSACEAAATIILEGFDDPSCEDLLASQLAIVICNANCEDYACEQFAETAINELTELQCEVPSVEELCAQVNDSGDNPAPHMTANNMLALGALVATACPN